MSVVFLTPQPVTSWDRHRWGFEVLEETGLRATGVVISDVAAFESFVRNVAGSAVFIDYLRGISGPDLRTAPIFRALRKAGAIYYVVAGGSLPLPTLSVRSQWRRLQRGLSRPRRVLRHAQAVMARTVVTRFGGYAPPWKIFGPPSPAVGAFASKYRIPPCRLICTHSLDYDILLRTERTSRPSPPFALFIDEGLAGHPDFDAPGRRMANPAEYCASLCRVFDRIEAATSYPVVVAAHPRGNDLQPALLGGRTVVRGRTTELVSTTSLVLAHTSTVLGMAALARKPVLLLGGRHVADVGLSSAVAAMAEALGVVVIDPDDAASLSAFGPELPAVSEARYARYVEQYVRPASAPDVSIWQLVAQHARADLEVRGSGSEVH